MLYQRGTMFNKIYSVTLMMLQQNTIETAIPDAFMLV
jgi:hypothetical protein